MRKYLQCLKCGHEYEFEEKVFSECPACLKKSVIAPLEVTYDYAGITDQQKNTLTSGRPRDIWDYDFLLPVERENAVTLGEGGTPLIQGKPCEEDYGLENIFFKLEYCNPTFAHKDRFHSVSSSIARKYGYKGLTTVSTGNHGASCVAYASAAGLKSKVFCPPEVSSLIKNLIKIYGGEVVIAGWKDRLNLMKNILDDGYFPSTLMNSEILGTSNPFGLEGYKTIAYEIFSQLGEVPEHVLIPCARGDSTYGVYKGFVELMTLGITDKIPKIYPCQPKGANSLEQSFLGKMDRVVTLDKPFSIAISIMEPTTGCHAYNAMKESHGLPLTASEEGILQAIYALGRKGFCVEAASAITLACVKRLAESGQVKKDDKIVCILTSAGIKWPNELEHFVKLLEQ